MLWFLVWTVLVLLGVALLARLGWSVFRKGVALAGEMGRAAELLGEAAAQADRLGGPRPDPEPEPAVFADPHALRRDRERRARAARRARRRT